MLGQLKVLGVSNTSIGGLVSVRINMLNETVNQTINFPGEEDNIKVVYSFKERALGDNYFSSIKANGIVLDVLGQKLTGNIDISPYEQGLNKGVKVNLSNGLVLLELKVTRL